NDFVQQDDLKKTQDIDAGMNVIMDWNPISTNKDSEKKLQERINNRFFSKDATTISITIQIETKNFQIKLPVVSTVTMYEIQKILAEFLFIDIDQLTLRIESSTT